jgi:protein-tyrosine phosphatase
MPRKQYNILFICTGNICRSPMAEYLLRRRMGARSAWKIGSAGLCACDGLSASRPAIEVLREQGVDLTPHRSRAVTKDIVDSAVLIVVMTKAHAAELKRRFPEAQDRIYLLKSFDPDGGKDDIPDPLGGSTGHYRTIRDEIETPLSNLILYLKTYVGED